MRMVGRVVNARDALVLASFAAWLLAGTFELERNQ